MSLKILVVASEIAPYAKTGGLADVTGSLPNQLMKKGVDIRVAMPKYKDIKPELLENTQYLCSYPVKLSWREQSASVYQTNSTVPTYLIQNDYYFNRDGLYGHGDNHERFAFFSKAAIELLALIDFIPDVIHCNDWQCALICVYLRDFYSRFTIFSKIRTLFTIHNIQYQGIFNRDALWSIDLNDGYFTSGVFEFYGNISFLKAGLLYANAINTVSDAYADEIQTPAFGYGLHGLLNEQREKIRGIVNGIDYDIYNPETDPKIPFNYSSSNTSQKRLNKQELQKRLGLPERDVPVISIISRLADQKGLDLISVAMDELLSKDIQFVVLGTGDGRYEHMFQTAAWRYPDRVSANLYFSEDLAQLIYAGSDIFLMPSLFEPCGLGQLMAMRYGTVPVVRKTGGLADTVKPFNRITKEGTGFVFNDYDAYGMMWALNEALNTYHRPPEVNASVSDWNIIIRNAMSADFSWGRSADMYIELYRMIKDGRQINQV